MDKVIRYTAEDALASGEPGFWIRACDFDERLDHSKQRETALQDRLTEAEEIDSDLVVIVAVLERRNAAFEELLHDLVPLLESPDSPLFWEETMLERIHALAKPTKSGASDTDDPFTVCLGCFGSGTVSTGIAEASSTICNECNGIGREQS